MEIKSIIIVIVELWIKIVILFLQTSGWKGARILPKCLSFTIKFKKCKKALRLFQFVIWCLPQYARVVLCFAILNKKTQLVITLSLSYKAM